MPIEGYRYDVQFGFQKYLTRLCFQEHFLLDNRLNKIKDWNLSQTGAIPKASVQTAVCTLLVDLELTDVHMIQTFLLN